MSITSQTVHIPIGKILLEGMLVIPPKATAIVIFVHGSGSSRHSPRNVFVAEKLQAANFATLLFDLLTLQEDENYDNRFNIALLVERLEAVTAWIKQLLQTQELNIGYFGASTGAAAALIAAANLPNEIDAIVSRGGRPDLASEYLTKVKAPTLLIVGGADEIVIELNSAAYAQLTTTRVLETIPGATHLFEEPGALEAVANKALEWFVRYL